jgi:hypothetical protein
MEKMTSVTDLARTGWRDWSDCNRPRIQLAGIAVEEDSRADEVVVSSRTSI